MIELVVINACTNIDIFAGLSLSARCRTDEDETEDENDEKNPDPIHRVLFR
jgi:hypothetical protein